jgi:hypothetical protein
MRSKKQLLQLRCVVYWVRVETEETVEHRTLSITIFVMFTFRRDRWRSVVHPLQTNFAVCVKILGVILKRILEFNLLEPEFGI